MKNSKLPIKKSKNVNHQLMLAQKFPAKFVYVVKNNNNECLKLNISGLKSLTNLTFCDDRCGKYNRLSLTKYCHVSPLLYILMLSSFNIIE